jgi:ribosomal-protein-alanine N-acetyltransferase
MATATKHDVQIRWLIRRDLAEVLEIERLCFQVPWLEEHFLEVLLRERNVIGMVATRGEQIDGFMVYELHNRSLEILNFAVLPSRQRQGVGAAMVNRLKDKLSQQRRKYLRLNLSESNLDGQLFFQRQRFWATEILRGYYENGCDAYRMEFEMSDG